MQPHLRVAGPVNNLAETVAMYCEGLSLRVLGRFEDHEALDGAMLGKSEVRHNRAHFVLNSISLPGMAPMLIPLAPSSEALLILHLLHREQANGPSLRVSSQSLLPFQG